MIHSTIHFPCNITKIPTPSNLSPYLQLLYVKKIPSPINCYYSQLHGHPPKDIHLIHVIITCTLLNRPLHLLLMVGNFTKVIFLGGHLHHGTHTSRTMTNVDWQHFIQNRQLSPIPNGYHSMYTKTRWR